MKAAARQVEKLPFWKAILYGLGVFGWSLGTYGAGNLLVYFYMPPEGGKALFPSFIHQGAILGIFTIIGVISASSRLFDAVMDPLIANWSDRSKSNLGRRRKYLAIGGLPLALFSVLVFIPFPEASQFLNGAWLTFTVVSFYFLMSLYGIPLTALMSELGHTADERLMLSTVNSIMWALGFVLGSQSMVFQGILERSYGFDPKSSFQAVMIAFASIGFIFMYVPVFGINERRYSAGHAVEDGVWDSLKETFGNKHFQRFVISDFCYWVAITLLTTGLVYYVTVLLELDKEVFSHLMLVLFALSFLFYMPVNLLAKKFGKKNVLISAFFIFGIIYALVFPLGRLPIPKMMQGYIIAVLGAFPVAAFGVLPNAMIGDISEAHSVNTGSHKAAMFFGARTFMLKMGQMIGSLIYPSLLLQGRSVGDDLGIRLSGPAGCVFCIIGMLTLIRYRENDVLKTLSAVELEPSKKDSDPKIPGDVEVQLR